MNMRISRKTRKEELKRNVESLRVVNGIVCLTKLRQDNNTSNSSGLSYTQYANFAKIVDSASGTLEIQSIQALIDKSIYYKPKRLYHFLKRFFDICLSLFMLILLFIPMAIIAIMIKADSKGPVFYKHPRIGKGKKIFNLYKFRSMKLDNRPLSEQLTKEEYAEFKKTYKLDNDPRITKFGKFLRKSSLDELPQLINILKGDMSFVGPRPIITEELTKYGKNVDVLLFVKPGLTSYWASHGRSNTDYFTRSNMELYYIKHRSLWFDTKIMFKTFISVIKKDGAK